MKRSPGYWTRDRIAEALRRSAAERGRTPRTVDWNRAAEAHPCHQTVYNVFGSWVAALEHAGLDSSLEPGRKSRCGQWGSEHHAWKGDQADPKSKRVRAVRRYELGPCERCDLPAVDRHHIDGDTGNNEPSNIAILCRRCHMEADGRLERFIASRYVQPTKPPVPCIDCEKPSKPTRFGRCHTCDMRIRRQKKREEAAA